jgi:hypothetical protein
MSMIVGHGWNDSDSGKSNCWEKNLSQCYLVLLKSNMDWPGLKPESPLWKERVKVDLIVHKPQREHTNFIGKTNILMFVKESANRAIDTHCPLQLQHIFITGYETMKYFKIICYIAVELTATWRAHCKLNVFTTENEDRLLQQTLRRKSLFQQVSKKWRKSIQTNSISSNFRFSPCIIIINHFYYPTNALNYTKLRG